ncbi:MFS transporter [Nonomuraea soli]|uniref:MFS family permease n=1 Tax=Nonomuraea soli TaxID=1032476 RepID=A0A7W0CII4_9ACTN|nr:MFS transporter [Nonomuraea soli]MBA2891793.1 MFS family permease [Nonomuraea soli]
MLAVLRNRAYRHLFTAQIVALAGTGLATIALSLLAYDLAGANATVVLGTALAIKMIAYVVVAPVASAFADRIPRRALMVTMDVSRATVALALPFVSEVWQVYVLIFVLQSASAAFTPAFQATIPDVLPDERDYTQALSLSRLAYDLESLFSPALAAALLTLISYNWLFAGTAVGFVASAVLVVSVLLPRPAPVEREGGIYTKALRGTRLFLATPRLRAVLALDLAAAAAGATVIITTVVLVQEHLKLPVSQVSLALGAYGAGSIVVAVVLPRLLSHIPDRVVMTAGAFALLPAFVLLAVPGFLTWPTLLVLWFAFGAASSVILTPTGRLIRRSTTPEDRTAVFAAHFSLSHGCWLLTYPLVGWLAAGAGMAVTASVTGALALVAALAAVRVWPSGDEVALDHVHDDLPQEHPHLAGARVVPDGWSHNHDFVIDDLHTAWPVARVEAHSAQGLPGPR